jgi:hypothetical protein
MRQIDKNMKNNGALPKMHRNPTRPDHQPAFYENFLDEDSMYFDGNLYELRLNLLLQAAEIKDTEAGPIAEAGPMAETGSMAEAGLMAEVSIKQAENPLMLLAISTARVRSLLLRRMSYHNRKQKRKTPESDAPESDVLREKKLTRTEEVRTRTEEVRTRTEEVRTRTEEAHKLREANRKLKLLKWLFHLVPNSEYTKHMYPISTVFILPIDKLIKSIEVTPPPEVQEEANRAAHAATWIRLLDAHARGLPIEQLVPTCFSIKTIEFTYKLSMEMMELLRSLSSPRSRHLMIIIVIDRSQTLKSVTHIIKTLMGEFRLRHVLFAIHVEGDAHAGDAHAGEALAREAHAGKTYVLAKQYDLSDPLQYILYEIAQGTLGGAQPAAPVTIAASPKDVALLIAAALAPHA